MALPNDPKERKSIPIYSGFVKYFPNAMAEVARLSQIGNDQHNPGKALHWDRSKSGDELDALMRHLTDHASGVPMDTDGVPHLAKVAWRAMAMLEKELERAKNPLPILVQQASAHAARNNGYALGGLSAGVYAGDGSE